MHRIESEPLLRESGRPLNRRFSDFWRGGPTSSSGNGPQPTHNNYRSLAGTSVPTYSDNNGRYNIQSASDSDSVSESRYSQRSSRGQPTRARSPISEEEVENSGSYADSFVGSVRSLHSIAGAGALERPRVRQEEFHESQDDLCILQACVFTEDAVRYHSIQHKVDRRALKLYQVYYAKPVQWCLYSVMFVLHALAFIEKPSSLTWSSDIRTHPERPQPPCGLTEGIEFCCLLALLLNLLARIYFLGVHQFTKNKWMLVYAVIIAVSLVDWCVSIGTLCAYHVRIRRMLRPFFLLQNSTLMKKTVNCLRRTLPQVFSVLLLLFVHLYFFSLFGMLLFPKEHNNSTDVSPKESDESDEQRLYFANLTDSFMHLLVLLTTANNPDVTMPAYSLNRFYGLFFITFLIIGLLCLMNMLTAVIYNQFRGYFSNSLQSSLFRRRLAIRAAFEVLRERRVALTHRSRLGTVATNVPALTLKRVLGDAKIPKLYKDSMLTELSIQYEDQLLNYEQFQSIFRILEADVTRATRPAIHDVRRPFLQKVQAVVVHNYFTYFSCFMACANVLCITVELGTEYEHIRRSHNTYLGVFNMLFVVYYLLEQSLRLWALGRRLYCWDKGNVFDGVLTVLLVLLEISFLIVYGVPFLGGDLQQEKTLSQWDFMRFICILIMVKLLRLIIVQVKAMYIVAVTLIDLIHNLMPFAGLLVVIYYSYALLGMVLFEGKITYIDPSNGTKASSVLDGSCGTYRQLEYWANNFDDFAAALVVLWDIMIVNNWHVFLQVYTSVVNGWSQLYFIIWWLVSVVITLNLFMALILENFIMKWDRMQQRSRSLTESYVAEYTSVHEMFREDLLEPSEEALMVELRQHSYLQMAS